MDNAREDFVERLKLAAQEVIDNAEDIVGNHIALTEVEVTIIVHTMDDCRLEPEISIKREFYSDKVHQYLIKKWLGE